MQARVLLRLMHKSKPLGDFMWTAFLMNPARALVGQSVAVTRRLIEPQSSWAAATAPFIVVMLVNMTALEHTIRSVSYRATR